MIFRDILRYYSRPDIQQALLRAGKDREVVGVVRSGAFSSRPNIIAYPQDISTIVRSGAIEFHYSIERWKQPMALRQDNYEELRKGFDLIIDLDCKAFEYGKAGAIVVADALEKHGINSYSIKFSGNTGFHVGIPWESIPSEIDFKKTALQFPDIARDVGMYLREFVRDDLEKSLLKESPEELAKKSGISLGDLLTKDGINPFLLVDVDPILISPRHLVRMPYSINKKAFLVSLPLEKSEIPNFQRENAQASKIGCPKPFLESGKPEEAGLLFAEAIDWASRKKKKEKKAVQKRGFVEKVPEEFFPPCINNINSGLPDGRKRASFILINFLHSMKWGWDEIEKYLAEWNKKNPEPMPENYIKTQVRYYSRKYEIAKELNSDNEYIPPPNCNTAWYTSIGVCKPDHTCRDFIKNNSNPINYPRNLLSKQKETQKRKRPRKKSK